MKNKEKCSSLSAIDFHILTKIITMMTSDIRSTAKQHKNYVFFLIFIEQQKWEQNESLTPLKDMNLNEKKLPSFDSFTHSLTHFSVSLPSIK